jgi:hypothetical protein
LIRKPLSREHIRLQAGEQQRIFMQLRRYFAPASIMPAPGSTPSLTGGRNTVLTAQNAANATPTDSATIALNGGQLTWYYKTQFKNPPNVTATAVQKNGVQELFLQGPGSNVAVVIKSTDTGDTRLVNLHAVGAPD